VRVHESQVKRVKKGMPVEIAVDAEPDRSLTGEVENVGVLPDSENRRFNPDQKVYKTSIRIAGIHDWLKPGMAAQARVVIRVLQDAVMVPVQSVFNYEGITYCCVETDSGPEVRLVQVDDYNNRFAAIQSGIEEGDVVYLRRPDSVDTSDIEALVPDTQNNLPATLPGNES
jgi:HlyD family secretion protein